MNDFFSEIKREHRQRREYLPVMTAEEAKKVLENYPQDTPAAYRTIDPAEFFDGAL